MIPFPPFLISDGRRERERERSGGGPPSTASSSGRPGASGSGSASGRGGGGPGGAGGSGAESKEDKERKLGHRRVDEAGQVSYKKIHVNTLMQSIQLGIQHSIGVLSQSDERDLLMQVRHEQQP